MDILFTQSMNCQPTQNTETSVSGTNSNSEPAIVALLRRNRTKACMYIFYAHFDDVCTLMMRCNDTSI